MAEIIEMPKLSDTMEEGAVASWLKKEGDFVEEGEALLEIETDKATMEYNSPAEGTLLKILVKAGESCALNSPIAVIGEKGEKVDLNGAGKGSAGAAKAPAEKPAAEPEHKANGAEQKAPAAAQQTSPARGAVKAQADGRHRSSPLARKVAEEKGLDITQIEGTGPNGRVIIRDVEQALAGGAKPAAASAEREARAPSQPVVTGAGDREIPVSMMRKTIAKRLLAGKNDAPHFYLTVSANMTKLNDWRKRLNAEVENYRGDNPPPKVSVNDLIVQAVAKALVRHPDVNASWEGNVIRQFGSVHVAIAVALPTGLVTPVVRNTNFLGVRDIARASKDLVQKAKSGALANEDYAGGTFTISNLGMFGIEEFTAIINPPQAGILAVGATIPTPWVDESGAIVAQPRMKMTMSCDHRVIDGALGAQFLQTLVSYLEDPLLMLA